jgi:ketosteroid isomerase-like protein
MRANVEIARELYPGKVDLVAALADEDEFAGALEALVHPDFETVTVPGQVPLAGIGTSDAARPIFHGAAGFFAAFREWLSAWKSWVITPTDFIEADADRVLVMLDIRARSRTHQVELPFEGANLLTFRDGRVGRLELFFDRAQARAAAGLDK